jgi:hypothetical protein
MLQAPASSHLTSKLCLERCEWLFDSQKCQNEKNLTVKGTKLAKGRLRGGHETVVKRARTNLFAASCEPSSAIPTDINRLLKTSGRCLREQHYHTEVFEEYFYR